MHQGDIIRVSLLLILNRFKHFLLPSKQIVGNNKLNVLNKFKFKIQITETRLIYIILVF